MRLAKRSDHKCEHKWFNLRSALVIPPLGEFTDLPMPTTERRNVTSRCGIAAKATTERFESLPFYKFKSGFNRPVKVSAKIRN